MSLQRSLAANASPALVRKAHSPTSRNLQNTSRGLGAPSGDKPALSDPLIIPACQHGGVRHINGRAELSRSLDRRRQAAFP